MTRFSRQKLSGWTREAVRDQGDSVEVVYVRDDSKGDEPYRGSYLYEKSILKALFEAARLNDRERRDAIMGALINLRRHFADECERHLRA